MNNSISIIRLVHFDLYSYIISARHIILSKFRSHYTEAIMPKTYPEAD